MIRVSSRFRKVKDIDLFIPIKGDADLLIDSGEKFKKGNQLFKASGQILLASYYLPTILGVKPDKAVDFIARLSGEFVQEGELLAERLASGGLVNKRILAGVDGIIDLSRISTGYIDILSEIRDSVYESSFSGQVEKVDIHRGVYVKADCLQLDYLISSTYSKKSFENDEGAISGTFAVLGNGDSVYTVKDLDDEYIGKIVFAGQIVYPELVHEIFERGALAVICNAIDYSHLQSLSEPTFVITGFGEVTNDIRLASKMADLDGQFVQIDPERKVVLWGVTKKPSIQGSKVRQYCSPMAEVGSLVKSIDPDHFGFTGVVSGYENEGEYTVIQVDENLGILVPSENIVALA